MSVRSVWVLLVCICGSWTVRALGQDTIVGSPHDLSVSGPGSIHALDEEQVCIFCHAPHNAAGQTPLWNRRTSPSHYRIYESSTTDARIDQPSGPSKLCLSCHDGAIAIGLVTSRPMTDPIEMNRRTIPPGPTDLTEDLSDDHPIGFRYDRALAFRDGQLKNPDIVTDLVPLGAHGEMHCTTCHDAHNNSLGDFLRMPKARSALCLACHEMNGWFHSSHALSGKTLRGRAVDPREQLTYDTVAENACTNCHKIHSAGTRGRLLRFRREEDNCLDCHDGGVARTNIVSELRKRSTHPVFRFIGVHDPSENPRGMRRHVECTDCHNPHAAAAELQLDRVRRTPQPVGPTTQFVTGVSRTGAVLDHARFEYEICFKCHAGGANVFSVNSISRQVTQGNTRIEFQVSNPSFHPVVGPRNNSDVVSLIAPLDVGSVIGCTDCHNSDAATGSALGSVNGPHGSIYAPLLVDNYSTADFTSESPRAYALCYRCHDRQSILSDESFPLHSVHIVRGRAPCSVCHDSHGVSRAPTGGRSGTNLINFDLSIVRPVSGALGSGIDYVDAGRFQGSCTLTCHGVTHVRFEYGR